MRLPPLNFASAHILIVGDVMLDRYWYGSASRISPEAPVPVVHIQQQEERPGGAGNVALNVTSLGAQATLIGLTGQDEAAQKLTELLTGAKVHCQFIPLPNIHTTTKLRVLSHHQQLIRLDFEDHLTIAQDQILQTQLEHCSTKIQVVVLSDYGKGTLSHPQIWIQWAQQLGKLILIDPKGQDFFKYRGATLMTPNLAEFETIVGPCKTQSILIERGEQLREQLGLQALLITRSHEGMTLLQQGQAAVHLPAQAREVYDVTGAGDTVIGVLATSLAAGHSLTQATYLANWAAGLVVAKLGTATVSLHELQTSLIAEPSPTDQIHTLPWVAQAKIHDTLNSLQHTVKTAQAQGKIVVMTNGCFDILHAGHIHYLMQARQLGDHLIVAVNDDNSIRRLKGLTRPIHTLANRLAVLSALTCIDSLIAFSEDTPEHLICNILPDILVKGGDYQPHQIAGSHCVKAQGGQVKVLPFLEGCSTTAILDALQTETTLKTNELRNNIPPKNTIS